MLSQIAAIRINVVLALGEMNDQEIAGNQKAKPLPQALTMLLALFNAKSADGKTNGNSDALRFAAMVGIRRHAESDSLTPESRTNIQQAMLALVKQRKAPEGRDQKVHDGLRRRAATTLGMLEDAGPNGAVAKALSEVVADPTEPIKNRAEMAAALGMLKAAPDTKFDFKGFANNIGWLLIDVGRPDTAAAADKEDAAAWRRLRTCVKDGIEGLGFAGNVNEPGQKKFIDGIVTKAKHLDSTLDNRKKIDNQSLARNVGEQIKELEGLLEPAPPRPRRPPWPPRYRASSRARKPAPSSKNPHARSPAGLPVRWKNQSASTSGRPTARPLKVKPRSRSRPRRSKLEELPRRNAAIAMQRQRPTIGATRTPRDSGRRNPPSRDTDSEP